MKVKRGNPGGLGAHLGSGDAESLGTLFLDSPPSNSFINRPAGVSPACHWLALPKLGICARTQGSSDGALPHVSPHLLYADLISSPFISHMGL